jgi:hypothetical protein
MSSLWTRPPSLLRIPLSGVSQPVFLHCKTTSSAVWPPLFQSPDTDPCFGVAPHIITLVPSDNLRSPVVWLSLLPRISFFACLTIMATEVATEARSSLKGVGFLSVRPCTSDPMPTFCRHLPLLFGMTSIRLRVQVLLHCAHAGQVALQATIIASPVLCNARCS